MAARTVLADKPQPVVVSGPAARTYNASIGYLRAFITLLVLAHHAVLAYVTFSAPPPTSLNGPNRWWEASPVVDPRHWAGFDILVGFNDVFVMSLMFFLSGLFVWKSWQRKGAGHFLRDRAVRLGLPFIVAAAVVAPIAYYPAYLQTGAGGGIAGFWHQWRSLGNWPAGPAWFVWLLLAFDAFAALLLLVVPNWGDTLARLAGNADRHPITLYGLLVFFSAAVYLPLALIFNPLRWSAFGPFTFQTSRGLHYLVYFLMGSAVGAFGLDRGLLAQSGKLARRWILWCIAALIGFIVDGAVGFAAMTAHIGSRAWATSAEFLWVVSCAAISFAFLGVFVRFTSGRSRIFNSLSANAYGMYLIHYAFVGWLQYALLPASLPAVAKGCIVFTGTMLLSWATTATLRRIPSVARVI